MNSLNKLMLAGLASATLVACGAGGDSTDLATQTKETASGAITGFGSVIVEGVKYEDNGAVVSNEIDATAPAAAALTDLKLGMQVEVNSDAGTATSVVIRAEVIASIESLAADGFSLAGQRVIVAQNTIFEGASQLSELAVGDYVEVHGQRDDAGNIIATRVERKHPDAIRWIRVAGNVASVAPDEQTFKIRGLTVAWTDDTRIVPGARAIVPGARVIVFANTPPQAGVLNAKAIRIRKVDDTPNIRVRIGGPIRNLDFASKTFNIHRFRVDGSEATYQGGSAQDLANGRWVRVRGVLQLDDAGKRVVKAKEIRFRGDFDGDNQVTGPISNFVSAASFMVRGVPIDASADTVQFENGEAADLANGVIVKVKGSVNGHALVASAVAFVNTDLADRRSVAGFVRAYSPDAGTFYLHGIAMQLREDTLYLHGDGSPASVEELNTGDLVLATGQAVNGVFHVARLVMRRGPSIVIDEIDGSAYNVDILRGRFHLNGSLVHLDDSTVFTGVRENLRNGVRVEVRVERVDGELVARQVEIDGPSDINLIRLRAALEADAVDGRIVLAGQAVDVTAATFIDGSADDLMAGRLIEVRGTVVDGVVQATRVEFEN